MSAIRDIPIHTRTCEELGFCLLFGGFSGQEREQAIRNAHLIDAAPALLVLVERYAGECGECGGRGSFPSHREDPGGHSVLECWECADIRAAIAKAEGQS